MLLPTSPEFVALCRSQVAVAHGLGASLSIVYLAKGLMDGREAELVPIVAYPESAMDWAGTTPCQPSELPARLTRPLPPAQSASLNPATPLSNSAIAYPSPPRSASQPASSRPRRGKKTAAAQSQPWQQVSSDSVQPLPTANLINSAESINSEQQMVLPLVYEGTAMGLLVTSRDDRPWTTGERSQMEQLAHTLAIACVLDQRTQWLMQANEQRQLRDRQQHFLLDTLLHQFRNPLTALRTFGKLLTKRLVATDPNREVAVSIVRESDRLQELLKQIERATDSEPMPDQMEVQPLPMQLAPAAPEQPSPASTVPSTAVSSTVVAATANAIPALPANWLTGEPLAVESVDLGSVLQPLLLAASAIAQDRNLCLEATLSPQLPPVQINAAALREVLNNLLENALKYTPANGLIQVQTACGHPDSHPDSTIPLYLAVAISDTGPGIPPDDLPHLFEPYYRGAQSKTTIPGTGLGMAIAHQLLSSMGGMLHVFSPGKLAQPHAPGTTVVTWLPIAEAVDGGS